MFILTLRVYKSQKLPKLIQEPFIQETRVYQTLHIYWHLVKYGDVMFHLDGLVAIVLPSVFKVEFKVFYYFYVNVISLVKILQKTKELEQILLLIKLVLYKIEVLNGHDEVADNV